MLDFFKNHSNYAAADFHDMYGKISKLQELNECEHQKNKVKSELLSLYKSKEGFLDLKVIQEKDKENVATQLFFLCDLFIEFDKKDAELANYLRYMGGSTEDESAKKFKEKMCRVIYGLRREEPLNKMPEPPKKFKKI